MEYFEDIYLKRLNRYGTSYSERIQGKREKEFESMLARSAFRIDYEFDGYEHPGVLNRNKQGTAEIFAFLLTRVNVDIPVGTVVKITKQSNEFGQWLILYKEEIAATGYNKYYILKLTHTIDLVVDGEKKTLYGTIIGPQQGTIRDTIKSTNLKSVYLEDFNTYCLIMSKTPYIEKETYFTIGEDWEQTGFRVTGYDLFSTPGVEYVSIDPVPLKDQTKPEIYPTDKEEDYFWLQGG